MGFLVGMSGDIKGKMFELDSGETRLGRASDNTIPLPDTAVSGHHSTIVKRDERYILRDEQSTNGTRLNAREITEASLKPKDLIQIGPFELLFEDPDWVAEEEEPAFFGAEDEVDSTPLATPESFGNVSPFAVDSAEHSGPWRVLLFVVAALAVGAWAFYMYRLFTF